MVESRLYHAAVLLTDGNVLVAGGNGPTAELYAPSADRWSALPDLSVSRFECSVTLLPHGEVLVASGNDADVYYPEKRQWVFAGDMFSRQFYHSANLLPDGRVLLAGGTLDDWGAIPETEFYEPDDAACPTNIFACSDATQCGAVVRFDSSVAQNCSYSATYVPPSGSFFPVGTNRVVCTAVDSASPPLTNTCSFQIIVTDCEPPVIHSIAVSPEALWPPNHKMRPVTLNVSATDNCHLSTCRIISITSNEASIASGSGKTSSDWQITGDLTASLRAERSGTGTGRNYSITVECSDDSGNVATTVAHVAVPTDM
jgi:hypothetical protein